MVMIQSRNSPNQFNKDHQNENKQTCMGIIRSTADSDLEYHSNGEGKHDYKLLWR